MANYKMVDAEKLDADLKSVADTIRAKSGKVDTLSFPEGFKTKIQAIDTKKEEQTKVITATENGVYSVTPDDGKVLSYVSVNVTARKEEQTKTFTADKEGEHTITPDNGKVLSSVKVNIPITFMDWANNGDMNKYVDFDFTGIQTIRSHVFSYSNLKSIIMPDVTSIGRYAFCGCSWLLLDCLPDSLKKIDFGVFSDCYSITIKKIPTSVESIEANAFYGCRSLTEITFEGTPSFVNTLAFYHCTNLTTINVPWAEGEVANAPWGATNATINYNYTETED